MSEAITPAHAEHLTLHIDVLYPAHEPRADDTHYAIFNQTRTRLEKLGALKCWIGNADCHGAIELHHDKAEFALVNDLDPAKFAAAYGLHFASDDDFLAYVEGEGNLLALCAFHHRSHGGIHALPYPFWVSQKYLRDGIAAPAREASPAPQSPPPPQAGPLPATDAIAQGAPN